MADDLIAFMNARAGTRRWGNLLGIRRVGSGANRVKPRRSRAPYQLYPEGSGPG